MLVLENVLLTAVSVTLGIWIARLPVGKWIKAAIDKVSGDAHSSDL